MFGKEVLHNGLRILLLFRYGEASRSGDDCHRKEILLPFLTGGAWHALQGHTGSTGVDHEAEGARKRHEQKAS